MSQESVLRALSCLIHIALSCFQISRSRSPSPIRCTLPSKCDSQDGVSLLLLKYPLYHASFWRAVIIHGVGEDLSSPIHPIHSFLGHLADGAWAGLMGYRRSTSLERFNCYGPFHLGSTEGCANVTIVTSCLFFSLGY